MRLDPQRACVLDRTHWNLPDQFLSIEINRAHAAERWGVARHAQRRLENVDFHAAIDAGHLRTNGAHEAGDFIGGYFELFGLFLGDQ